jgi:hypothetical protein
MVRMLPLDRVSSSNTKGRSTREQVAEEMQTLMRHRTVDKRGCATLLALGEGRGGGCLSAGRAGVKLWVVPLRANAWARLRLVEISIFVLVFVGAGEREGELDFGHEAVAGGGDKGNYVFATRLRR